jgi:transcriptional regulator of acetoin/glycerol metabolism
MLCAAWCFWHARERSRSPLDSLVHGSQHTTLTRPASGSSDTALGSSYLLWLYPRPSFDAAQTLALPPGAELVLGRDERCDLPLGDADVSRRHACLRREADELVLCDLGSRNGTFVNARRITRTPLRLGDVIRVGGSVAIVSDAPGVPAEIAPGLLGGPRLAAALADVRRAASSDLPVIVEGETGTGKEVVARAIHGWSGRAGAYLAVNCAALPEALAEGELFGYRKGAFTGAERASTGLFRAAHGGTLLLDEVSELPLVLQAKLLRVLEQREVQPLGEAAPVPIDTRVIVATQTPLRELVARRQFREDLLARLDGVSVRLPPLRERAGDVPALFTRAFSLHKGGSAPALEAELVERLCAYDWPFNVREVVLLARRLAVLSGERLSLSARDLPSQMQPRELAAEPPPESARARPEPLSLTSATGEVELPALLAALRVSRGNVAQAALVLGISRQRAYRLMQGHAVDLNELREQLEQEAER